MKRLFVFVALAAMVLGAAPARADKCPLDIHACLQAFAHMRDRPWLGVEIDTDSLGVRHVVRVVEGSPAAQAGIKPGDVLRKIDGQSMNDWFAGRSGWVMNSVASCVVERGDRETKLALPLRPIPEDVLDRMIGKHMLEEHLAYGGGSGPEVH